MIEGRTLAGEVFRRTLWLAWQWVRVSLFLLLGTIEPVVSFALGSLALLGILMTFFWWSIGAPHFPIVLMLGISLSLAAALAAYQGLLRLLNR